MIRMANCKTPSFCLFHLITAKINFDLLTTYNNIASRFFVFNIFYNFLAQPFEKQSEQTYRATVPK